MFEEDYTKGVKLLAEVDLSFEGRVIKVNIYKSKTRDASKKRFLVWFPEHSTCSMVWKGFNININDVGKSPEGHNWYSYADRETRTVCGVDTAADYPRLEAFTKMLFDKHEELLEEVA